MDKALLLAKRIPTGEVSIPGVGMVIVRGLSRKEMLSAGGGSEPTNVTEQRVLAAGMVDPVMTVEDIAIWQECAPAMELQPVLAEINRLSGIGQESQKEAYKSV